MARNQPKEFGGNVKQGAAGGGGDKCAKMFAKWEAKCNGLRSDNMDAQAKAAFKKCKADASKAYKAAGC